MEERQKNNRRKKWWIIGGAVLFAFILATVIIGNYFVDYALTPNGAGSERETSSDVLPQGVEGQDDQIAQQIEENRLAEEKVVSDWLLQTENLTEEVEIKSEDDLTLRGTIYHQPTERQTNRWAVMVHGYQVDKTNMYPIAQRYWHAGYNVLAYDQRGLGESDGEYITMGIKEKQDLISWLEALIHHYPAAEIITHGESMGAATVMLASGHPDYPRESVHAVIADCGYSGVWEIFASELRQRFNLPAFPVLYMAGIVAYFRADINVFSEGDVTEALQNASTPTLFIHGTADDFVPFPMVEEVYAALPISEKEKYIVEGAGHAEAKYKDPEAFNQKIADFINKYHK